MTFSPTNQEIIRAIVREEIALDEMKRQRDQASSPAYPRCGCTRERAVSGMIPTMPGTIHLSKDAAGR